MNRIYLVGYMGAGKTTAAKRLAHRLGWEHYDTDALFEEKYHISVDDFFTNTMKPCSENWSRRFCKVLKILKMPSSQQVAERHVSTTIWLG